MDVRNFLLTMGTMLDREKTEELLKYHGKLVHGRDDGDTVDRALSIDVVDTGRRRMGTEVRYC